MAPRHWIGLASSVALALAPVLGPPGHYRKELGDHFSSARVTRSSP